MNSSVNAVIVTYNRKDLLRESINAVFAQTVKLNKLIVIDNASTDGTDIVLEEYKKKYSNIVSYTMSKNYGGAGGFYYGIRKAYLDGCDYVWAMDDDTIPSDTALEELLIARTKIEGQVSFLASAVYGPEGEPMNVPTICTELASNGYQDWYYYLKHSVVRISSATLVSLLFDSNAIKKVGAPHPDFFIWGDDTEYTLRMTHYFAPAYFVGKSVVLHKRFNAKNLSIVDDDNANRIKMFYHFYTNNLVLTKEYFSWKNNILLRLRLIKDIVKIISSKTSFKSQKIKTILKGYRCYLLGQYGKKNYAKRFSNVDVDMLGED